MRLVWGFLIAVLINWGLFSLMQRMTHAESIEREITETITLDFVRVQKEETAPEIKRRELPQKPPPPDKPPPPPEAPTPVVKVPPPPTAPPLRVPKIDMPLQVTGTPYLGDFSADKPIPAPAVAAVVKPQPKPAPRPKPAAPAVTSSNEVVAVYTTKPKYPRAASRRGLEGVVTVSFTITAAGTVINPRVVKATPKNTFNKAALKAIAKWKFKPRLENGKAVSRQATQEIVFKLAK